MGDEYAKVGASASKAGLHQARARAGLVDSKEFFSDLLPDLAGDPSYYSFLHCDGAGTKSIVAYLLFRETGDYRHFAGLAQDALVMNIDDIYAVGAPERCVVANLVARNARLIDDEVLATLITSYRDLVSLFAKLDVPIELGGGETADTGDVVRTLLVDAVLSGRMKKENTHSAFSIQPGDDIIGFSSTGRASYEERENSGIGSNGLTLARHALLSRAHAEKYPEVLAPEVDQTAAYRGRYFVTDRPKELAVSAGEALLSPTRSYAPLLSRLYKEFGPRVRCAFHLTGGGQTKPLRFGNGLLYIKDNVFPVPPLFQLIEKSGGIPRREMYQVFNMGHRMEVCTDPAIRDEVIAAARTFGIDSQRIGEIRSSGGENRVAVSSGNERFEYTL